MDWINASNPERGTMTINVGSKNKWKQRLNYSCGLFQPMLLLLVSHAFSSVTHS